jgi:hypothetical protein
VTTPVMSKPWTSGWVVSREMLIIDRVGMLTANATVVGDFEIGADTGLRITVADSKRSGCDANGEDRSSDNES